MANYSFSEMADMHFMYGKANGSAHKARRLYQEAFPNREVPSRSLFTKLHQRLRENGSFKPKRENCGRPRSTRVPEVEERILEQIAANPGVSTRKLALQEEVPKSGICEILHEELLRPYHLKRVQELKQQDLQPRLEYCQWLRMQCRQDRHFLEKVLFTDEAGFGHDSTANFHNTHIWADVNPHAVFEARFQNKFTVNVWAGILGNELIGPYVIPNNLNGVTYLNFLQNILPDLLDNIPYRLRLQYWYMHDGAPAHFSVLVREHLNRMFGERWIGRGGPVSWPPRSPDLNPMDYFLWGYLKTLVYSIPIENEAQLRDRITNQCEVIRNTPGIFERVRSSMRNRVACCIDVNGGHFEHML